MASPNSTAVTPSAPKSEIDKAQQRPKAKVQIERTATGVQVNVEDAPRSAGVYLVVADSNGTSKVSAGENNGRQLHHVAIVRSLKKIGSVKHGEVFHKLVDLPKAGSGQRVIVFLQDLEMGPVSGAAVLE